MSPRKVSPAALAEARRQLSRSGGFARGAMLKALEEAADNGDLAAQARLARMKADLSEYGKRGGRPRKAKEEVNHGDA